MLLFIADSLYPILGWIGTLSYLLAYFLLSIRKVQSTDVLYHFMNIIGAVGLMVNALHYADMPNVVVNIAWGLIAIGAILFIVKKKVD